MNTLDWIVLSLTVIIIIGYGLWKTKKSSDIHGYLLGDNEAKWWTVGLSVMVTQASAIIFLSTPGQAYHDGMGFAQFYLMLPVAMIIICITFIPLYYKLKVYTAYEFLEKRFDLKTRVLTSSLFLIQRGISAGITIYAPSIVLHTVMGWDLKTTVIIIGLISILYTVSGGTKAVHVTHKHQMIIILCSLVVIFFILMNYITEEFNFIENLKIAKASDKLEVLDFSFDINERYNIWSSFAAIFLFLSYFGTDQSQVQRYISGRSIKESRLGLIMNGIMKLPLQLFILFLGIMVFLFYQSHKAPIFFNQQVMEKVESSEYKSELASLQLEYDAFITKRTKDNSQFIQNTRLNNESEIAKSRAQLMNNQLAERSIREKVKNLISKVDDNLETNDKDYVFINFILNHLPNGLIGLLLAVIFFAAMSSTSSELNALASTSTVDIYKRILVSSASESHYVFASKMWTVFWGIVALGFALYGNLFENLIQYVNIIGSLFYGTILGIFLVAFYFKRIGANDTFIAAIITFLVVVAIYKADIMPFLWLNVVGALGVILISLILSQTRRIV